ncbi:hypothetical protein NDU88_000454 [Pleurodeles waltl]|uniref:Uncharacterized protein n=1 Tax=Pleurodeles waltl TaxID=8319 RepID=A0AAV7LVW6_PLEWA|nr:hypothetical protein NDU88_000454 [Pleurodeles waltl]
MLRRWARGGHKETRTSRNPEDDQRMGISAGLAPSFREGSRLRHGHGGMTRTACCHTVVKATNAVNVTYGASKEPVPRSEAHARPACSYYNPGLQNGGEAPEGPGRSLPPPTHQGPVGRSMPARNAPVSEHGLGTAASRHRPSAVHNILKPSRHPRPHTTTTQPTLGCTGPPTTYQSIRAPPSLHTITTHPNPEAQVPHHLSKPTRHPQPHPTTTTESTLRGTGHPHGWSIPGFMICSLACPVSRRLPPRQVSGDVQLLWVRVSHPTTPDYSVLPPPEGPASWHTSVSSSRSVPLLPKRCSPVLDP